VKLSETEPGHRVNHSLAEAFNSQDDLESQLSILTIPVKWNLSADRGGVGGD